MLPLTTSAATPLGAAGGSGSLPRDLLDTQPPAGPRRIAYGLRRQERHTLREIFDALITGES